MIVLDNEPMIKHTTFRTGGPAKRFIKAESVEDIIKISKDIDSSDNMLIIGNGSNLLVSDKGIDATVVQIYDEFNSIDLIDDVTIHAEAGALLSKIAVFARDNSLTGFEFASGIPGTVGGAVFMNAGAYGGEMIRIAVTRVYAVVNGKEENLTSEDMQFGYRESVAMHKKMIITRS